MNTSQFMDKQIMDLSNSQGSNSNSDFLDLINPPADHHHHNGGDSDKKEEILPSYDFQPIRPIGSSSPPSKMDSGGIGAPRAWNSADNNKTNASGTRNYTSLDSYKPARFSLEKDSYEPARFTLENDQSAVDPTFVSEIDRTMKKYADNLMHGLDGISARLSQLESRTRHLENSLDELKVSVGTNYGTSDGRMRQMENMLREVQTGVQTIKDKQEIMDARLELAKVQIPKVERDVDIQSTEQVDSSQVAASIGQQSHQQLPPVPLTHPPSLPNAPPPPASQQNIPPQVQLPSHFPPGQIPPIPQRESYFAQPPPPQGQAPENLSQQQYQLPPGQQLQAPSQPQPQHQYQPAPPQLPFSQPPGPQPHTSLHTVNPSQPHPPIPHHHPEESPYAPSQNYPPAIRQNPPPPQPSAAPPQQQFYGAPANIYEPPPNRPSPGFSGTFGPSAGSGEQYPYGNSSSQYGSGSPQKPQQMSSPAIGHGGGGGGGYPQLPTARILPHAVPTATAVGSGPGSPGSGNRVPIDDVVDKVTNMGFSREQVRATVRRLTENGQAVDLNVVLDKLMNGGDVQPPRGWFGR